MVSLRHYRSVSPATVHVGICMSVLWTQALSLTHYCSFSVWGSDTSSAAFNF